MLIAGTAAVQYLFHIHGHIHLDLHFFSPYLCLPLLLLPLSVFLPLRHTSFYFLSLALCLFLLCCSEQ